jgi:putative tricarboxylic transport membrane protein
MRAADLVTAGFLIAVAGVVLYDALRLGIGWSTDGPKSGFFPFWLALVLLVCAGAVFMRAWRRHTGRAFVSRGQLVPVAKVLVPIVIFILLTSGIKLADRTVLPALGLYVAAALYLAVYMRWVGRHRWVTVVVLAVAIPVVTFMIFEKWFVVPMPKGPLEDWLGH